MQTIRDNLSRYRNELKGIAILWVVFFHAKLGLEGLLYQVQRIGYGGVDLFFFLSGFGLYYTLERDADLGRYLKRRARRLLPAYLPFCVVWLAVMLPLQGSGIARSLRIVAGNLTMCGFFAGVELNISWYISAMLLSILLAPLLYTVLRGETHFWVRAAALICLLFAAGLGYIGDERYMAISRLPVFALGMVFAAPQAKMDSSPKLVAVLAGAFAAGLAVLQLCLNRRPEWLIPYAMYWHPFVLITPGLCVGLSWLFAKLPKAAGKPFALLGKASFEIFLFNVWIELLGVRFGLATTPLEWLEWSLVSIVAGCVYHWIVERIYQNRRQKI